MSVNIKVTIRKEALEESAFIDSVNRATNRDRFKTKRSIATLVDIGLEKNKLTKKNKPTKKNIMNKLFSIRIKPHFHRFEEGKGITLVTKRNFVEVWLLGFCFSFNAGCHPHYDGYFN